MIRSFSPSSTPVVNPHKPKFVMENCTAVVPVSDNAMGLGLEINTSTPVAQPSKLQSEAAPLDEYDVSSLLSLLKL